MTTPVSVTSLGKVDTGLCGFCLCLLWGDVADGGVDPRRSCPGCRLRHRRAAPARPGRDRARRYVLCRFGLYESNQREVGPPVSSKTATPNHVFPVIPGDRDELAECRCEATRG